MIELIDSLTATEYVPTSTVFLRLAIAAILGLLVGLDREVKSKPMGFRPYMLVSVGAAGFAILVMEATLGFGSIEGISAIDPSRVMQGVIGGIGFLGAGAIMHSGGDVRGASTGAGIWLVGGVGMAAGFGFINHAVALTVVALAVFIVGGLFRSRVRGAAGHDEGDAKS